MQQFNSRYLHATLTLPSACCRSLGDVSPLERRGAGLDLCGMGYQFEMKTP